MTIIHPTWERDFIRGLRNRVLLKKQKQENINENDLIASSSSSFSTSLSSSNNKQPYIVGLIGLPGSGKVRYNNFYLQEKTQNLKNKSFFVFVFVFVPSPLLYTAMIVLSLFFFFISQIINYNLI